MFAERSKSNWYNLSVISYLVQYEIYNLFLSLFDFWHILGEHLPNSVP